MKTRNSILIAATLLSITACGGGSGEDSTQPTSQAPIAATPDHTVTGKVIDGYVSGATVFLDLNGNGTLQPMEPSAVTNEEGDYSLALAADERECLAYVPLIIDVPVGAIDLDLGVVEEAYQMVVPPQFGDAFTEANATPLTTALWEIYQDQFVLKDSDMNNPVQACNTLKANHAKIDDFKRNMGQTIKDIVHNYNIPESALFADFIANGDTETHELAMLIVKGLKKSLQEQIEIQGNKPDAHVMVNYLKRNNAWFRKEYVFDAASPANGNGWATKSNVRSTTHSVSSDLEVLGAQTDHYNRNAVAKSQGNDEIEIANSSESCDSMEYLYYFENATSSSVHERRVTNVTNTCGGLEAKYLFNIKWSNKNENTGDYMQIIVFRDEETGMFPILDDMKDFNSNRNNIDYVSMTSEIDAYNYSYDDTLDAETMAEYFGNISFRKLRKEGSQHVEYYKNLDSSVLGWDYVTTRTNEDGTYTKECKAPGADNWSDCT